jgi:hypothetical protein
LHYGKEEERLMPIAKITGQGLAAIGLSVALLWGCFVGEKLTMKRAVAQNARLMSELREMRRNRQMEPVSAPMPGVAKRPRVRIG